MRRLRGDDRFVVLRALIRERACDGRFNASLHNGEIFCIPREGRNVLERRRHHDKAVWSRASPGTKSPAPEVLVFTARPASQR